MLFGSVKEASIGPTSLMALLTLQYTIDKPIEFVIILTLFSGFVEFLMGAINLGKQFCYNNNKNNIFKLIFLFLFIFIKF